MNIILCGLPASGKTSIGKKIANEINYTFIDTDILIEIHYHINKGTLKTCREIFQVEGETFFRDLEKEQIFSLKDVKNTIIALGGGALKKEENKFFLKNLGTIFYLKTNIETAWNRIENRSLPAYLQGVDPKATFCHLAENRISAYEEVADIIIDTFEISESDIVKLILKYI